MLKSHQKDWPSFTGSRPNLCNNNDKSIRDQLVCDGWEHCSDGEDEQQHCD